MTIKIHFKYLIAAILSLLVAIGTLNGSVQEVIHFAGALNEMAFAFVASMMSILSFIMSIEKVK